MRPGPLVYVAALLVLNAAPAWAGKPARRTPAPAAKAAPPEPPALAPVAPPAPARRDLSGLTVEQLLAEARKAFDDQEYDQVPPLTEALLSRPEASNAVKLDAYQLQGSSQAIAGSLEEAQVPFRLLLRLRPDFDLPAGTAPKILAAFRKVQAEEAALADQVSRLGRSKVVEGMALVGALPRDGWGGYPLRFRFRLKDPTGAVETVQLPYRRAGQAAWSAVALARQDDGSWAGVVPGEATASPQPFELQYFVETRDGRGALLKVGAEGAPLLASIRAGAKVRERPPPVAKWGFFTALAATVALGGATGGCAWAASAKQAEYDRLVARSMSEPVSGRDLDQVARRGETLVTATNVGYGVTAAMAIVTAILIPFVNWDGVPEQ